MIFVFLVCSLVEMPTDIRSHSNNHLYEVRTSFSTQTTQTAMPFGYGNKIHQISVKLVQNTRQKKKRHYIASRQGTSISNEIKRVPMKESLSLDMISVMNLCAFGLPLGTGPGVQLLSKQLNKYSLLDERVFMNYDAQAFKGLSTFGLLLYIYL